MGALVLLIMILVLVAILFGPDNDDDFYDGDV